MECQEPNCHNQATMNWKGRKVCHDHYDKYSEQHDSMASDIA